MCTVSMVGEHYSEKYNKLYPDTNFWSGATPTVYVSQREFEALKRDVEEMKKLLLRAKEYDERNNEPHCEMDEKVALLKQIAKVVGVDLSAVFGADPA